MIGYKTVTITDVKVIVDRIAKVSFEMEESVIEGLSINKYTIPPFQFQRMIKWEETVDDHLWIQRSPSRARADVSTPPPAAYNISLLSVESVAATEITSG